MRSVGSLLFGVVAGQLVSQFLDEVTVVFRFNRSFGSIGRGFGGFHLGFRSRFGFSFSFDLGLGFGFGNGGFGFDFGLDFSVGFGLRRHVLGGHSFFGRLGRLGSFLDRLFSARGSFAGGVGSLLGRIGRGRRFSRGFSGRGLGGLCRIGGLLFLVGAHDLGLGQFHGILNLGAVFQHAGERTRETAGFQIGFCLGGRVLREGRGNHERGAKGQHRGRFHRVLHHVSCLLLRRGHSTPPLMLRTWGHPSGFRQREN